ncbi:hypothetical protein J7E70_26760 [Variovorax paradoxus]|nr:hypothetical protein [Variovorax paradoxus]
MRCTIVLEFDDGCRFPFNLSLLIFQLALLTLSICHRAAGGPHRTPASLLGGNSQALAGSGCERNAGSKLVTPWTGQMQGCAN